MENREARKGIQTSIRDRMAPQQIRNFNKLVEIARITENNLKRMGSTTKTSLGLKRPIEEETNARINKKNSKGSWNRRGSFKGKKRAPTSQTSLQNPICPQCVKHHGTRPCLAGQGVCFKCGNPSHMARECPQPRG